MVEYIPIGKFDAMVVFLNEVSEGEIYRVISEGVELLVKVLSVIGTSRDFTYMCNVIGDTDRIYIKPWSILAVSGSAMLISGLEKKYYDLFM